MFDPQDSPRVFGLPPGVDFAQALVSELLERTADMSPTDIARIQIFVNTSRMQRRLRDVFGAGKALLLPRIRLITDLARDPLYGNQNTQVSPLRRRLEIVKFVSALLDQEPELAPRAALFDLADSLANLMDEMQGEGVTPDDIATLDVSDQSGHWDRALRFLRIITPYFSQTDASADPEARQRIAVELLREVWANEPPSHPIIVAGSTGSRGATNLFMQTVASLPQGAIVLPGFDFDMPDDVWNALSGQTQDHPQYRFKALCDVLNITPGSIVPWAKTKAPHPARNALVSLSLRPAPVTDQWLHDGPNLGDLHVATKGLTLVEASSPRSEAITIALRLRQAVADGITAALVSPDRNLTRQVTAALDLWDIKPDDSAGVPLQLSPPGRFLRQVADLGLRPLTGENIIALLKHPLCHSTDADRGPHLRNTRELELFIRRKSIRFVTPDRVAEWANDDHPDDRKHWADWVSKTISQIAMTPKQSLTRHIDQTRKLAEAFAGGLVPESTGGLWDQAAGREALRICDLIARAADAADEMTANEFVGLFGALLAQGVVRDRDAGHPQVLIWGTLEARVQSADLVILGGMNEGVWPEAPGPDPWLNRKMRAQAGLLVPERRIGLSAHDYQQAVAGNEVWITRAKRSADAETVPSRWVNRLLNLLRGLPNQGGQDALAHMQREGDRWIAMAEALSQPERQVKPAHRPSPRPPIAARPKTISVTQLKTLIRDPYAIYADKVLRVRPLDPLVPNADAALRGVIIHAVLEEFISLRLDAKTANAREALRQITKRHFTEGCPWPAIRAEWIARMERLAPLFLQTEAARQERGALEVSETSGRLLIPTVGVEITCKADRIDLSPEQDALIYDYKTGQVPTANQQKNFDKQLLVEAVMVERGAFASIGERRVAEAAFLGVNNEMKIVSAPLSEISTADVYAGLEKLFSKWADPQTGYSARMALFRKDDLSWYDHLARFGEWTLADKAVPEDIS